MNNSARGSVTAALIGFPLVIGLTLVAFAWMNRPSSSPAQTGTLSLQVPQAIQASPQTNQPSGAIPTGIPTLDPRTPSPVYSVLPASPGPRTPIPTNPIPTWTARVPGDDPSFNQPPNPGPAVFATPRPSPEPNSPWGGGLYVYRYPDTQDSTRSASLIIRGTVKHIDAARWTTPDGKRPANPFLATNRDTIFRPVLITVDSSVKGYASQSPILLMATGGTVGQDTLDWASDDLYSFHEGDKVLLFLSDIGGISRFQTSTRLPLWQVVEHYTINANGDAANAYGKLPLAQLLSDIQAAQAERP